MVVIARVDAKLREHGVVDEVRVPQVAVEEGEGGDALLVGEHRCIEDDPQLVLRPTLDVLATDDVHDALVRVEDHVVRRMITGTCEDSGSTPDVSARLRYHSKHVDDEQTAHMIQGTSQWSHRRAGSGHARECAERAAGSRSARVRRQRTCLGGSEGPLASVIYAGRLRSVGPVPRRSSRVIPGRNSAKSGQGSAEPEKSDSIP